MIYLFFCPLGDIRYLNQLHQESISLFYCFKSWSVYHMLSGASDFYICYCIFVYPLFLRSIQTLIQSSLSLGEINADHSYSRGDLCYVIFMCGTSLPLIWLMLGFPGDERNAGRPLLSLRKGGEFRETFLCCAGGKHGDRKCSPSSRKPRFDPRSFAEPGHLRRNSKWVLEKASVYFLRGINFLVASLKAIYR